MTFHFTGADKRVHCILDYFAPCKVYVNVSVPENHPKEIEHCLLEKPVIGKKEPEISLRPLYKLGSKKINKLQSHTISTVKIAFLKFMNLKVSKQEVEAIARTQQKSLKNISIGPGVDIEGKDFQVLKIFTNIKRLILSSGEYLKNAKTLSLTFPNISHIVVKHSTRHLLNLSCFKWLRILKLMKGEMPKEFSQQFQEKF